MEVVTPKLQPVKQPPEQVILFRLRTEHNRLNAHIYNKLKVGESEMCPCNADMTTEYLLQHCQLYDALRRDMWPEPIPLRDKLYGNLEDGLLVGNMRVYLMDGSALTILLAATLR